MSINSNDVLEILSEMRDLLRLLAEPAIAERDKKMRVALRAIAGSSAGKKAKSIVLMDGVRTRQEIIAGSKIDASDLSALVKKLTAEKLLVGDAKQPRLAISIPSNFFDLGDGNE